jgi:hypothetical protein
MSGSIKEVATGVVSRARRDTWKVKQKEMAVYGI